LLANPQKRRSRYNSFLSTWMVKAQDHFIKYGGVNANQNRAGTVIRLDILLCKSYRLDNPCILILEKCPAYYSPLSCNFTNDFMHPFNVSLNLVIGRTFVRLRYIFLLDNRSWRSSCSVLVCIYTPIFYKVILCLYHPR